VRRAGTIVALRVPNSKIRLCDLCDLRGSVVNSPSLKPHRDAEGCAALRRRA
jgi:hypothetical protein